MPFRKITFEINRYYHLFNRGVNRSPIFFHHDHYLFLLDRIGKYFSRDNQTMIVYCLMPNHYHFLVRQDGNIELSKTMQAVFNSYSKAINHQLGRTGTLFEDRFKSIQIDEKAYLVHLCRYIHRNPIDSAPPLVDSLVDWSYSNYPEWINQRNGRLVDRDFISEYFDNTEDYKQFVYEIPAAKVLQRLTRFAFE